MDIRYCFTSLTLVSSLAISSVTCASEQEKPATVAGSTRTSANLGMPVFVRNIAPDAVDAVKIVEAFSAAIKAAKMDVAKNLLDPDVLILESGGSERSRDQYMGGHAIADAGFLRKAQQQLRYRQARADGSFAWVATESTLTGMDKGKKFNLLSTETMLLRKTAQGWKIVHIHWSSHPAPKT